MSLSEEEFQKLLSNAKTGHQDALMELVLSFQAGLGKFVNQQIGNHLAVVVNEDDILQETFVHALRSITKFQQATKVAFIAWLKAIAMNRIREAARKSATLKRGGKLNQVVSADDSAHSRAIDLISELSGDGYTPSVFAAQREAVNAINAAMIVLPEGQRTAIQLHCIEKMSLDQTAEKMDKSRDSVRGLIQRGKEALRQCMQSSSKWFSQR